MAGSYFSLFEQGVDASKAEARTSRTHTVLIPCNRPRARERDLTAKIIFTKKQAEQNQAGEEFPLET
jgi:hypothetical protein